jgi:ATP-dependent 26S proteasome regulatory subunit
MKTQITNHIRAGYPGLYIVTHEEQRIELELSAIAKDTKFKLFSWSLTEGVVDAKDGSATAETNNPIAMLAHFDKLPDKSILLARDLHMFLADPNPMLFRRLKDSLLSAKNHSRTLVICGCQLKLPPELEKYVSVMDFSLPGREQLKAIMQDVVKSANEGGLKIKIAPDMEEPLTAAAAGLTTIEAENAFALSIVECTEVSVPIIQREKANIIRKNGLLEIVSQQCTLADIGGLERLKSDLVEKRGLFTQAARAFGLPTPRGVLSVGQPGTGKSLVAQAIGSIFGLPCIRLEAGKLFGSLVGQSESNWRAAFATAKAIAPCILWIDEVDGLFAGAQSSGQTDSGVTARVIKAILQDMQMNSEGIFYYFTANDIDGLPDPLIDRLDVYSVDLPTASERRAIWSIHIAKRNRDPKKFGVEELASVTDGFSGRQIEQVWLKAMTVAFNANREPKNSDVIAAAGKFVATSITMKDAIENRRKRLKDRATPASAPEVKSTNGRKLAVNRN